MNERRVVQDDPTKPCDAALRHWACAQPEVLPGPALVQDLKKIPRTGFSGASLWRTEGQQ